VSRHTLIYTPVLYSVVRSCVRVLCDCLAFGLIISQVERAKQKAASTLAQVSTEQSALKDSTLALDLSEKSVSILNVCVVIVCACVCAHVCMHVCVCLCLCAYLYCFILYKDCICLLK